MKHPILGELVQAHSVQTNQMEPKQARRIIWLLAGCVSLMMTGFGIILPVFARRLSELGSGVEALGWMTMAFALSQFIASPWMGGWADRYGRKPLILIALAGFVFANIGYLLAPSVPIFIGIRGVAGAITAGLFPAAMGVVADIIPQRDRARWIGIIMGGYGAGIVFGPVLGGVLYDSFGFSMPFISSAIIATCALIAAFILIPETRPRSVREREALRQRREQMIQPIANDSFWQSLPKPLTLFGTLLLIDFLPQFAFTFVEPQMVFYFYDDLLWSTSQFGLVVGAYGLSMMLGQVLLGQVSDRFGRKPVIVLGLLLSTILYVGLTFANQFWVIMVLSAVAGFGIALFNPALSALYLDVTDEKHRSRVQGIKGSALALGGVMGPLLVAIVARFMSAQGIFITAGLVVVGGILMAVIFLKEPKQTAVSNDLSTEIIERRSLAAQATLRGLVMNARAVRQQ